LLLLKDSSNYYNIYINDKFERILKPVKQKNEYILFQSKSSKVIKITIYKRSEGYDGIGIFKGLEIKGELLELPRKSLKKIEFIGDSISVGFGVEGTSIECDEAFEKDFKNFNLAFPAITATLLNVDYNVIAVSGRGLVRNWDEPGIQSRKSMTYYYDKTLFNNDSLFWDYSTWIPDIVVINLGTNDFSQELQPSKELFINEYMKFIKLIRKNYPQAHIFCISGPAQTEPFYKYISELFEEIYDKAIHLIFMAQLIETEKACSGHPNIPAQERMANELVREIHKILPTF